MIPLCIVVIWFVICAGVVAWDEYPFWSKHICDGPASLNADNAYERLIESTFAIGRQQCTITPVKDVPKGADSL